MPASSHACCRAESLFTELETRIPTWSSQLQLCKSAKQGHSPLSYQLTCAGDSLSQGKSWLPSRTTLGAFDMKHLMFFVTGTELLLSQLYHELRWQHSRGSPPAWAAAVFKQRARALLTK